VGEEEAVEEVTGDVGVLLDGELQGAEGGGGWVQG
jgi:hypothetical protein